MTNSKYKALEQLALDKDIFIKKSDNGSCICIMDATKYIVQGIEQLSDTNFYIPERSCMTKVINIEVHKTVDAMIDNGSISDEVTHYLKIDKPKNPSFYLLLKIHKNILPPPGRPILSANDSPTERISAFVDHFLQPYVPYILSFIKDNKDFVRKIESSPALPNGALLVMLDVTSLFTNIPHWEGLSIVHRLLSNKRSVSINNNNTFIDHPYQYRYIVISY